MQSIIKILTEIINATKIFSPTRFSVAGQISPDISSHVQQAMSIETARKFTIYNLQQKLYEKFICGMPTKAGILRSPAINVDFVQALSHANKGDGYWEGGWEVQHIDLSGHIAVRKHDLTLWIDKAQLHPDDYSAIVGTHVKVKFGKERRNISPGFYMAAGNTGFADEYGQRDILRFYWNMRYSGAVELMRLITTSLNNHGIPFDFKIVNTMTFFNRRDAAVLYVNKKDYEDVAKIVKEIYRQVSTHMNSEVPLFTKSLAKGLGFAEDPGHGESFGEHRARVLAEGVYMAYDENKNSVDERLNILIKHIQDVRIDLQYPYLNPGSLDIYQFHI